MCDFSLFGSLRLSVFASLSQRAVTSDFMSEQLIKSTKNIDQFRKEKVAETGTDSHV